MVQNKRSAWVGVRALLRVRPPVSILQEKSGWAALGSSWLSTPLTPPATASCPIPELIFSLRSKPSSVPLPYFSVLTGMTMSPKTWRGLLIPQRAMSRLQGVAYRSLQTPAACNLPVLIAVFHPVLPQFSFSWFSDLQNSLQRLQSFASSAFWNILVSAMSLNKYLILPWSFFWSGKAELILSLVMSTLFLFVWFF